MKRALRAGVAVGAVLAIAACCALTACGRSSTSESAVTSPSAVASAPPIDHLAPGELLDGPDEALGVRLPRGMKIEASFHSEIYASAPYAVDELVRYFRAHLEEGSLREGTVTATFEHVKAPGGAGPELSIHIARVRDRSQVDIKDETPPPAPDLPDEAARWRHVGLTPNGRLLDPKHLD